MFVVTRVLFQSCSKACWDLYLLQRPFPKDTRIYTLHAIKTAVQCNSISVNEASYLRGLKAVL